LRRSGIKGCAGINKRHPAWPAIALFGLALIAWPGCGPSQSKPSGSPQSSQSSGQAAGTGDGRTGASETVAAGAAHPATGVADPKDAGPENQAAAKKILEAMVAAYHQAKSYSDRGTLRFQVQVDSKKTDEPVPFSVTVTRPDKMGLEIYQAVVACDGKQIRALIKDLPKQMLVKDAPVPLTMKGIYSDRVLNRVLTQGIAGPAPQLILLFSDNPLAVLLRQANEPVLLAAAAIDGHDCDRVSITRRDGTAVLWIDRQTHLVRRMEYPVDDLRREFAAQGHVEQLSLTADFADAQLDAPSDAKEFDLEMPAGYEAVKFFIPPHPAQLLGKKVPAFKLEGLDGKPLASGDLAGKVTVIDFWATECPPCRTGLPNLEKVYQKYKDRVAFLTVSEDQPDTKKEALLSALQELGITIPPYRDTSNVLGSLFQTPDIPAQFLLGADGTVEDYKRGYDEKLPTTLPAKLDKLLAGSHIYETPIREYQEELKKLQQAPESPADEEQTGATSQQREIPRAEIAKPSTPNTFQLKPLWSCGDLKAPGNILVVQPSGKAPQILVIDSWKKVVQVGLDGKVLATHELGIPDKEAAGMLRSGVGADGKRFFVASASAQQQVHLFDEDWKLLVNFPADALENPHPGIADVQIGDLDGDGKLKLYVGYWGSVGVQAVSLEGKRLWSNRTMEMVLRVAFSGPDAQGRNSLLCVNNRGTIVGLDAQGQAKSEIAVGNRPIQWIVAADLEGHGRPAFCGLTPVDLGVNVAVGFTLDGRELWRRELPRGVHQQPIEMIIAGKLKSDGPGVWLLPAADGSIHVVSADGKQTDRFNYGSALSGLATAEINGRPVLLVASAAKGLEALEVQ
jgi:thiol-disulfide isomerase/thioredoxin